MTSAVAIAELNIELAHLWMIRTFLKHADEIQEDAEFLEVPRTLYDSIRAVEPAFLAGDHAKFLRRLRGKLPKLKKIAEFYAAEHKRISPHTNYEMAAVSLTGSVRRMEEIFTSLGAAEALPVEVDDGE